MGRDTRRCPLKKSPSPQSGKKRPASGSALPRKPIRRDGHTLKSSHTPLDLSEKLSANFSLRELVVSQTAVRCGIPNLPSPVHIENLRALCTEVLQPARDAFGPILVTSGYRSARLNRKIRGAARSQHCLGQAADIIPANGEVAALFNLFASLPDLPFDQLIYEFGVWVHVSHSSRSRRQRLRADRVGRRVVYRRVSAPIVSSGRVKAFV